MILIAIALFVALSYALSQGGGGNNVTKEKTRLAASNVIDLGTGLAEAATRLRLHNVADTKISFENSVVAGYTNAACSTGSCKVFDFNGGGKDWETPSTDINNGTDIGITGSLAIKNMGSSNADLVMLMPNISSSICSTINILLGIHDSSTTPAVIATVTATKFTGAYSGAPTMITHSQLDGQKSGCFQITTATGSAFSGTPLTNSYTFYQILLAR